MLLAAVSLASNGENDPYAQVFGVGYYERSEKEGVNHASFNGGTEILISAAKLSPDTHFNYVQLVEVESSVAIPGPLLSGDNLFRSQVSDGKLQYTLPSLADLLQTTEEDIAGVDSMNFRLEVVTKNVFGILTTLRCQVESKCSVTYNRDYTPVLFEMNPPVSYYGQVVAFTVDPKYAEGFRDPDEMPFSFAKIGSTLIDFEGYVSTGTNLGNFVKNQVLGEAGDMDPALDNDPLMRFTVGDTINVDELMIHCNYAGDDCYTIRTAAIITSISSNEGYTQGQQVLTINGQGFTSEDIVIEIPGTTCELLSRTDTQIVCETKSADDVTVEGLQPGQNGLLETYHYGSIGSGSSFDRFAVQAESFQNRYHNHGRVYSGLFKAPDTTDYRFYMACDDSCELFLSSDEDPANMVSVLVSVEKSGFRDYYSNDQFTDLISMTAGNSYYIEIHQTETDHQDHVSVAVEIVRASATPHPNQMREVQRLQINPAITRERTQIIFEEPDGLTVNIKFFLNAIDFRGPYSVSTFATAEEMRSAIWPFYREYENEYELVQVTLQFFDDLDTEVFTQAEAFKNVYTVEYHKSIDFTTSESLQFISTGTLANAYGLPPDVAGTSNIPLSGKFAITCFNPDNTYAAADGIAYDASPNTIKMAIEAACPLLKNKITVWDGGVYNYYVDGRDLFLKYDGIASDMMQAEVEDGLAEGLVGNMIQYDSTTYSQFGSNLFYEPIPYELLHTLNTVPDISVKVNGVTSICVNFNCQFKLIDPEGELNTFTYTEATKTVVIQGTDLPTVTSVEYASQDCAITASSATEITCILPKIAMAGSWRPIVRNTLGRIPHVRSTFRVQHVEYTITSISPSTDVNPLGGQTLTLIGTNFPGPDDMPPLFEIYIDDTEETICDLISTFPTEMQCILRPFISAVPGNTYPVEININRKQNDDHSITLGTSIAEATQVTPTSYSPVLKTELEVKLSNDYSGSYDPEDFTVKLVQQADPTIIKELNVMSTDQGSRTLTVKYGGAYSGTYDVLVSSESYGELVSSLTFVAEAKVTAFSGTSGSINGGTILTFTGYTFSDDPLDNNVEIGDEDCPVIESSETEIKCISPVREERTAETEKVYIYLKASEMVVWDVSNDFTWTDTGSQVTAISTTFDDLTDRYILTIDGVNFDGDDTNVEVHIDGYIQTTLSVSSTQITVEITGMNNGTAQEVEIFMPSGHPSLAEGVSLSFTVEPALASISPALGSPAGSVIVFDIQGVGVDTQDLVLLNGDSTELCAEITIESYGVVYCLTFASSIASGNVVSLIQDEDGILVGYSCAKATSFCEYSTDDPNMPSVSSISVSTDQTVVTFTGSLFLTAGFDAFVSFAGGISSSASINSASEVVATFDKGLPLSDVAEAPALFFQSSSTAEGHYAINSQTLTNPVAVSGSTSTSLSCSFAGGCPLTLTMKGLANSLKYEAAAVTVCSETCELVEDLSNDDTTVCNVPALPTRHSILTYEIQEEHILQGTTFSSNPLTVDALLDGDNVIGFEDTSVPCHFGMHFKANHVGIVTMIKLFMNSFTKSTVANKLSISGSNDDLSYTTILTVGNEVHEGWNYYLFQDDDSLKYRYYKFEGTGSGSCNVGELELWGVEAIDDLSTTHVCTPKIEIGGVSHDLLTTVTYDDALTPLLESLSPRYGTVEGGTEITFTGTNFPTDMGLYSIEIDEQVCTVTSATLTEVRCLTDPRPGLYEDTYLSMNVDGYGNVATRGLVFRYVSAWSASSTWGGEASPQEGETVWVPAGMHLLVDVDCTPIINLILVEGSLIFEPDSDPDHERCFNAYYIFIHNGYMEVGTEEHPYTSKLTITLHGNKETPEVPVYGSKVLAVRNGQLEMHGEVREPTWTELETTVEAGSNTLTLHTAVDWKVGEEIVIAPTSFEYYHAEIRAISDVDRTNVNNPVITLNASLSYQHYAGVEFYGTHTLEMRAEVGLLTRNVIFRGDSETSGLNKFGAHIMMHSPGDESVIGRIEYVEFFDVGQAYMLGRYPIQFHRIGTVAKSYIRGNSIFNSYNRAVTINDVEQLRILDNVAYNVMGHAFFFEDGREKRNILDNNLVLKVIKSWALLNTDLTPASFWITNPDNILRNNRAAGSDSYGFWYNLLTHSSGSSFDDKLCPINEKLGEFDNNVAHSNGRYGVRIYKGMNPRKYPCNSIQFDQDTPEDPYHANPLITADFTNFLGYKNKRNGAIAERVGDVRFTNFKLADNRQVGIEFSVIDNKITDGLAQIREGLIVGRSVNDDGTGSRSGIVTARSENFTVNNVDLFNFDGSGDRGIGSCSHCNWGADSGARTVTFSGLSFTNVPQKVKYNFPYKAIYHDLDGTLTGIGANTWATPDWKHNTVNECDAVSELDGLVCDSTVQVRRIAFDNYDPNYIYGQTMKILRYDESFLSSRNVTQYTLNHDQYSKVAFRWQRDPYRGWVVPFVTGHTYKIHWGYGLDFTRMRITYSNRWVNEDINTYLIFNHTDIRQAVEFYKGDTLIPNDTLAYQSNDRPGDNLVLNDTETRQIHTVINGKNHLRNPITMIGIRCIDVCMPAIEEVVIEDGERYWSDDAAWPSGVKPVEGEDVVIESGWNMILDEDTPILGKLEINGRLTFLNELDLHLEANYIFVRAGELIIGNDTNPFLFNAVITLHGSKENQYIAFESTIEAGDKILINTGRVEMHGVTRTDYQARVLYPIQGGVDNADITTGLDWVAGDVIGFAPTTIRNDESDFGVIVSYDSATGHVVLDRDFTYYHWGDFDSTAGDFQGVDMRGEVFLLNRNIKLEGEDIDAWGCQFITSDFVEENDVLRAGQTILNNVEVYNCSQYDTYNAALRFEQAKYRYSHVQNTAIHHGLGWGLYVIQSENVLFENNIIFDFVNFGANLAHSTNLTFTSNLVANIHRRAWEADARHYDSMAGVAVCAFVSRDPCVGVSVTNNIVAGTDLIGILGPGHECHEDDDTTFRDNVIHSVKGMGAIVFPLSEVEAHETCFEGDGNAVYKCTQGGVFSYFSTLELRLKDYVLIDNGNGVVPQIGKEADDLYVNVEDFYFYGETAANDCPYEDFCLEEENEDDMACVDKFAALLPYFSTGGVELFSGRNPPYKPWTDASYGGRSLYKNHMYINFPSNKTFCGMKQRVFSANKYGSDYHPQGFIDSIVLREVHHDALIYIPPPNPEWASIDNCGLFPCTGLENIIIRFFSTDFQGTVRPDFFFIDWLAVSNNVNFMPSFSDAFYEESWNAYYTRNSKLSMYVMESLDNDRYSRSYSPLSLVNLETSGHTNVLNHFMDHGDDRYYTSQLRLSRYGILWETGDDTQIFYTGSVPKKQRMVLISETGGNLMRIDYQTTQAFRIINQDGEEIPANDFDDVNMEVGAISGRPRCGENRFVGVENYLEFYIERFCTITIDEKDSIMTRIRLDWTLEEFFEDGGSTHFIDRLCGALGIHASDVKVVAVYEGSVIVDYLYLGEKQRDRMKYKRQLTKLIQNELIDLGAPILDAYFGTGDDQETIISSDSEEDEEQEEEQTTTSSSEVETQASSSSSNTTSVQVGNNTIVISNQNQNPEVTTSEGEATAALDTTKIIIICVAMGVLLLGLMILAIYLYKRNKALYEAKGPVPAEDLNSPDLFKKMDKNIKMSENKYKHAQDSSMQHDRSGDNMDIVVSDMDPKDEMPYHVIENNNQSRSSVIQEIRPSLFNADRTSAALFFDNQQEGSPDQYKEEAKPKKKGKGKKKKVKKAKLYPESKAGSDVNIMGLGGIDYGAVDMTHSSFFTNQDLNQDPESQKAKLHPDSFMSSAYSIGAYNMGQNQNFQNTEKKTFVSRFE